MHTLTLTNLAATYGIGGILLIIAGAGLITYGFAAFMQLVLWVSDTLFGPDSPDSQDSRD